MRADFSGYASKNDLLCADGRIIRQGAFAAHDGEKVPLVWSHDLTTPENVLGHGIIENRPDGTYVYGHFNDTDRGRHMKEAVKHGDITAMSIFANNLQHRGNNVVHGVLREVSLVAAGANPGAMIDNLNLQHSVDGAVVPDTEAIIYTDEGIDPEEVEIPKFDKEEPTPVESTPVEPAAEDPEPVPVEPAPAPQPEPTIEPAPEPVVTEPTPVVEPKTEEPAAPAEELKHAEPSAPAKPATTGDQMAEKTVKDVYDAFSDEEKDVVHFLIGSAIDNDGGDLKHSYFDTEGNPMNVFAQQAGAPEFGPSLSHDAMSEIVKTAEKNGSLKDSFLAHADVQQVVQDYGIENIDILFPDAQSVTSQPEIIGRRTEWVADVLASTKHSPIARIKSTAVDLTAEQARAKGYVKGNLKKDEIVKLLKRVTTPKTIYKKQKLDRDDIIDITGLDVVAWIKAEMRVMLDEEIARSILIGDGRESDDEDKIDEEHIRPIAYDADMYAHQVTIGSELTGDVIVESVLRARTFYKGTGTPTFYTTDKILTDLMLVKDKIGRRLYETEAALAAQLRVNRIVTVEVMDDAPEIVGIVVNLADYTVGADRGGAISLFDDFDIDYNQYKYLIETRISGALTKPKSAVVLKRTIGTLVTPAQPSFNSQTNTLTIPDTAGIVYSINGEDLATGPKVLDESSEVDVRAKAGFTIPAGSVTNWYYSVA
jgi:HK97 family phage prohead protease